LSGLFTVSEVLSATGGELLGGTTEGNITGVVIDSREAGPGDLFVALAGEHTDGHRFVRAAMENGASAALVSRIDVDCPEHHGFSVIRVPDCARALGLLARFYRQQFSSVQVVAITGSVGKTTTKDMIASVLARRAPVLKTYANWNTELGVPLMIFQLRQEHRFAVLELAMRNAGEIRALTRMSEPHVGVITNIQDTHMELLGSQENIAWAKAELLEELRHDGTAVLNADDDWVRRISAVFPGTIVWYGQEGTQDYIAGAVVSHGRSLSVPVTAPDGSVHELLVPMPGEHNAYNVLAAVAACRVLGAPWSDIEEGLRSVDLTGMRMEVLELGAITVLNDAYNANPTSTIAALKALRSLAGERRRVVVLGDMLELGEREEAGHREVGRAIASEEPAWLATLGHRMRWTVEEAVANGFDATNTLCFGDQEEALRVLRQLLEEDDVVLVKGSRGMALENIVEGLKEELG